MYLCATLHSAPVINESTFLICTVFDYADFNVCLLTGLGTSHSLGGIKCVSPSNAIIKRSTFTLNISSKIDSKEKSLLSYKPLINGMESMTLVPITVSDKLQMNLIP